MFNETIHSTGRVGTHLRCLLICLCIAMLLTSVWTAPAMADEQKGTVTASALIIRSKPSTESEGLRTVKQGAALTILGTEGSWYKVQHGVIIGYAYKSYVKLTSSAASSATSTSSTESLPKNIEAIGTPPSPTREGDKGNDVKKLQQALKLKGFYNGSCDGIYGTGTVEAVKAFQQSRKLTADGIAGNATIKYLFGSTAESTTSTSSSTKSSSTSYKTEKPDWFNGGSSLIQKGAVFYIKDVRTGRTFRAKRWSGSNHIDAEPYTAEDTATMLKCYGGSWSWSRRPILVLCNNRVFAASMNGMPHGTATIKNNNYDGHFCIHFYKSKTHETKKVDSEHQTAVSEAAKASW